MSYPALPAALSAAKSSNPLAPPPPQAPPSPRNSGSFSAPSAVPPFQLPVHLPRHSKPGRPAHPRGSCLHCLHCKESGPFLTSLRNTCPFPAPPYRLSLSSWPDCWNEEAPLWPAVEFIHQWKFICGSQLIFQFLLPNSRVALRVWKMERS